MTILGIDPGIHKLGYAFLEKNNGEIEIIEYGLITTESRSEKIERVKKIKTELVKLIKKYRPEIMGLEKILFFKNKKTVIEIAQIIGMLISIAVDENLKIIEFSPPEIKMAITGFGRADKLNIKKMLELSFKLRDDCEDDVYDALAIALTTARTNKEPPA